MRHMASRFLCTALLGAALLSSCDDSLWGNYDNPYDPTIDFTTPQDPYRNAVILGLNWPRGLAIDSLGQFYIAQENENDIVRFDTQSKSLTIYAGIKDIAGFVGDNGYANMAKLNRPRGMDIDTSGNLYISDTENHCIRWVDTSGIIRTIAGVGGTGGFNGDGSLARDAWLSFPKDIAIGPNGDIYISDTGNNRIRRIDSNGTITTIAGTDNQNNYIDGVPATEVPLNLGNDCSCGGIDVDTAGNLYIAETGNHCVLIVNTAGIITTFAGTGYAQNTTYEGSATSVSLTRPVDVLAAPNGTIYIVDQYTYTYGIPDSNGTMMQQTANRGRICKVSGGLLTNVMLYNGNIASDPLYYFNPTTLALGPDGTLYVTDAQRGTVIRVVQ